MTAVIEWIMAGMVVEGMVLLAYRHCTGRGLAPGALLPNLVAGAMLLLAMRLAMSGAWQGWAPVCLLGALAGHLFDLRARWPN